MSPGFAVIFDCDGVLIDSAPAIAAAHKRAFSPYGIRVEELQGYHRAHSVKMLLSTVEKERGVRIDPNEFTPKLVEHIVGQLRHAQIDPDLLRLIQDLNRRAVPMAVGSSATRPSVEGKLVILGIREALGAVVSADDVTRHKPAPDVYLEAARRLGADPARCVVVEDNDVGVQAAHAAGMRVVSFGKYNQNPHGLFGGDMHVTEWAELSYQALKTLSNVVGENK